MLRGEYGFHMQNWGRFAGSAQAVLALLYAAWPLPSQGFEVAVNVRTAFYLERNAVAGVSGSEGILLTNVKDTCRCFSYDGASQELHGQE